MLDIQDSAGKPAVSIIIPVYNVEPYLKQCMDSVVSQSLENIEIVCINDGSTDGSLSILEDYASNDARIRVITQSNSGYGAAMNKGIGAASGMYIGIVEPDDYISADMFEKLYARASMPDGSMADVVKSAWYECDSNGTVIKTNNPYSKVTSSDPINLNDHLEILMAHPSIWSGIYRKDFLEDNGIRFKEVPGAGWVDNPFFIATLFYAQAFMAVGEPFYHYRTYRDGSSSDITNCLIPFSRLQDMFDFLESVNETGTFFKSVAKRTFIYLRNTLDSPAYITQRDSARGLIGEVMARIPSSMMSESEFSDQERENYERFLKPAEPQSKVDNPRLSLIVPCCNNEKDERKLLQSILRQDIEGIETIVVDFGSADRTRFEVQKVFEDSPCFEFASVDKGMLQTAIGTGLRMATAEYVAVVGDNPKPGSIDCKELLEKLEAIEESQLVDVPAAIKNLASVKEEPQLIRNHRGNPEGKPAGTPDISIILPVYNCERFIDLTLFQLISQTVTNIEIICVDDGSTDQSAALISKWCDLDDRITLVRTKNGGAGAARNAGLERATGKYLSFLDADDLYDSRMLEMAYEKAESLQADMVIYGADFFYSDKNTFEDVPWLSLGRLPEGELFSPDEITYDNAFRSTNGWAWDKLFRRSYIESLNIRFQEQRTYNDMSFTYTAYFCAKRIAIVRETLIHQRKNHGTSLSQNYDSSWWCFHDALVNLKKELSSRDRYDRLDRDYRNYTVHMCMFNVEQMLYSSTITKLYPAIRDKWIYEFGTANQPDEFFIYEREREWFRRMESKDLTEFLLDELIREHKRAERLKAERGEFEKRAKREKRESDRLRKRFERKTEEVKKIKNSTTYKAGKTVTWLPKKLRSTFKR